MTSVFRLSAATVVDLMGQDAAKILHNLTTNEVKTLAVGEGCESFITDVRGKTLAHVQVVAIEGGFRLIGAAGQADAILGHVDRYTIREDCAGTDRSEEMAVFVLSPESAAELGRATVWAESNAIAAAVGWLGPDSLCVTTDTPGAVEQVCRSAGSIVSGDEEFHAARTTAGFPWYGIDLSEKNLPQEANRISQSICFTKGCYLGQETVARLDALGQVQKQLVRWQTSGKIPDPGAEVTAGEKVVGRLTSVVATSDDSAAAIGIARRSHFEAGSEASGDGFRAVVL